MRPTSRSCPYDFRSSVTSLVKTLHHRSSRQHLVLDPGGTGKLPSTARIGRPQLLSWGPCEHRDHISYLTLSFLLSIPFKGWPGRSSIARNNLTHPAPSAPRRALVPGE